MVDDIRFLGSNANAGAETQLKRKFADHVFNIRAIYDWWPKDASGNLRGKTEFKQRARVEVQLGSEVGTSSAFD